MSGLEVAGVVLGAIPILLASLKLGGDAIQRTKRLLGYKAVVNRYQNVLTAEAMTYKNILYLLLEEVVSASKLKELLDDPGGKAWKDGTFRDRLTEQRLGESYVAVIGVITEMDKIIREFSDKIGAGQPQDVSIPSQHKPETMPEGLTPCLIHLAWSIDSSSIAPLTLPTMAANELQMQGKHLVFKIITYQSTLDGYVKDLGDHNRRLEALARLAIPVRGKTKANRLFFRLENFRDQALALYRAIQGTLTCICQKHNAAIVLDDRSDAFQGPFTMLFGEEACRTTLPADWFHLAAEQLPEQEIPAATACSNVDVKTRKRKRVTFKATTPGPKKSSQASISVIGTSVTASQTAHTTSYQNITNFCQHLHTTQVAASVLGPGKISDTSVSFSVATSGKFRLNESSIPSFRSWLNGPQSFRLSLRDKMHLAVTMSTAILGLCETPWIPWHPQQDEILLVRPASLRSTGLGILTRLRPGSSTGLNEAVPKFIRHPTFFMLGILLIELIFGLPIDHLGDRVMYRAPENCSMWQKWFDVAVRLLEVGDVLDEGGQNYEVAVQNCIHGNFGMPGSKLNYGDRTFRQSVYDNVVSPLDENMMAFKLKMSK